MRHGEFMTAGSHDHKRFKSSREPLLDMSHVHTDIVAKVPLSVNGAALSGTRRL